MPKGPKMIDATRERMSDCVDQQLADAISTAGYQIAETYYGMLAAKLLQEDTQPRRRLLPWYLRAWWWVVELRYRVCPYEVRRIGS